MSCTRTTYTGVKMRVGWSTVSEAAALLEPGLITAKLVKAVNENLSRDTVEDTGAGEGDKTYEGIQRDGTISIDGFDDLTTHELEAIFDADIEDEVCGFLAIMPQGWVNGEEYIVYQIIPTGFTRGREYNGKVAVTITGQKTGPRSKGTLALGG